jgi:hypothetical protein
VKQEPIENDALWRALGEATPPLVSPFFARNVLRATRQQRVRSVFLPAVLLRWIGALAFSCVTVGFFVSLAHYPQHESRDLVSVEIFDIAAGLNELAPVPEITLASLAFQDGGF